MLIEFKVEDQQISAMMDRYGKRIKGRLNRALNEIRIGFQQQLRVEFSRGNSGDWQRLSSSYLERKEREFPGRPILVRTEKMLKGYIRGVRVNPINASVEIDFPGQPGTDLNTRAKAHQGVIGRPKNMPVRPIPTTEEGYNDFRDIAIKAFREALNETK